MNFQQKISRGFFQSMLFSQLMKQDGKEKEMCSLDQVHGTKIVDLSSASKGAKADGWRFKSSDLGALVPIIRTADCMPIYLQGQQHHFLVHAGWRGLAEGILRHPWIMAENIEFMFIGPCIHQANYEVGPEFAEMELFKKSQALREVKNSDKMLLDLVKAAYFEVRNSHPNGKQIQCQESGVCTFGDPKFPSYRRDQTTERLANFFLTRPIF